MPQPGRKAVCLAETSSFSFPTAAPGTTPALAQYSPTVRAVSPAFMQHTPLVWASSPDLNCLGTHRFNNTMSFILWEGGGAQTKDRVGCWPWWRARKMAVGYPDMVWCCPPCPAACDRAPFTTDTLPSLYPGPARAVGHGSSTKESWPGRSWSLSGFHLLKERGPTACCQVGWGPCSSKKQEKKNR